MSSNTITPSAKFLSTPASLPWSAISGAQFMGLPMIDIDGDGQAEVIAITVDPLKIQSPSLGILSYFDPTAFTQAWAANGAAPQMIATSAQPATTLGVGASVQVVTGNILGSNTPCVVTFDGSTLTPMIWVASTGLTPNVTSAGTSGAVTGAIPAASAGGLSWTMDAATMLVGDIDGDGQDEIVFLDATSIATVKWSGSEFQCLSVQTGIFSGANGASSWSYQPASQGTAIIGDVNNDSSCELLLQDTNNNAVLLGWIESSWSVLYQSTLSYEVVDFVIADIDGDGNQEVVCAALQPAFIFKTPTLIVMRWSEDSLATLDSTNSQSIIGSWFGGGNVVFACPSTGVSAIVSTNANGLFLITWNQAASFNVAASATSFSIPNSAFTWTLQAGTVAASGDVDGDGVDELILMNNVTGEIGVTKLVEGTLELLWLAVQGNASMPMAGWGMGVLYNAPSTSFGTLPGPQATIYSDLATQFGIDASSSVRGEYINANNANNFAVWSEQIQTQLEYVSNGPASSEWQWLQDGDFAASDIEAVFSPLVAELAAVSDLYAYRSQVAAQITNVANQCTQDLATVVGNLETSPPAQAQVSYWPGQILDAVLWAAAAIPGLDEVAMPMAAAASIFGSLINAPQTPQDQIAEPSLIDYADLQASIASNSETLTVALDTQLQAFMLDPVKLPLLGPLLENEWQTSALKGDESVAQSSIFNRLSFYKTLMPTLYTLFQWQGTNSQQPWMMEAQYINQYTVYQQQQLSLGNTTNALWVFGSGPYEIWLLVVDGSWGTSPSLPGSNLLTDLFMTIGIPENAFFDPTLSWNLPIQLYSIGDPQSNGNPCYITNSATDEIWFTGYNALDNHVGTPQSIAAGQTIIWTAFEGSAIGAFKIRGQLNGNEGDPFDTSMQMSPQLVSEGNTATTQTMATYFANDSGGWWQMDN